MFAVQCGEHLWGPFKTADAAAKWAAIGLVEGSSWRIIPLTKPQESH